jgi:hypothetical protein
MESSQSVDERLGQLLDLRQLLDSRLELEHDTKNGANTGLAAAPPVARWSRVTGLLLVRRNYAVLIRWTTSQLNRRTTGGV